MDKKLIILGLFFTITACSSNTTENQNSIPDSSTPINPIGDAVVSKQDSGTTDAKPSIPDAEKAVDASINKDAGGDASTTDSSVTDANDKDAEADASIEDSSEPDAETDSGNPECTFNARRCSGLDRQICNNTGNWETDETCPYLCSGDGVCTGECEPTTKQCSDKTPQTCDSTGYWVSGSTCPYVCSNGDCIGVCTPDSNRCDGLKSQTCNSSGQWETDQTCPYVCSGEGNCTGECVPTSKDCVSKTPRTCNSSGQWVSGSACTYVCSAGSCTGVCNPGVKQCSDQQIQTCSDLGQWGTATNCPIVAGATAYCSSGSCTFNCNLDYDDCDGNPSNGCEVNLNTDKVNCGTCGHSCCGGACSDGTCGVGNIIRYVSAYLPTASYLYWSNATTINQRPRDGDSDTTLVSDQNNITAFTLQGSDIFWLDKGKEIQGGGGIEPATGGIYSTPIGGGATTKYDNVGGYGGHIIVTATDIFYTQRQDKSIIAYILRSNPEVNDYVLAGIYAYSEPFVTDGTYVYAAYQSYSSNKIPIVKAPIHGGTVTTFETANLSVAFSYSGLVANGSYLYYSFYTSDASGGIYRKPFSGETATRIVTAMPATMTTDGTNVYYSDGNARQVLKVSVNGGASTVLASFSGVGAVVFANMQVANGCLYWIKDSWVQAIAVNP